MKFVAEYQQDGSGEKRGRQQNGQSGSHVADMNLESVNFQPTDLP
jgi:hypothetical protein